MQHLLTVEPERINAVTEGGWETVELYVDSGATETVIGEDTLQAIEARKGEAQMRGVHYEVANGVRIPNMGEKEFKGVSEDRQCRNITAQVCDVNKAQLSVSKAVNAGNRVVFDEEESYIENKYTGEKLWLE